jgi:hypothetical protein
MKPEGSLPCSKDSATNGISRTTRIQSMSTHSISWRSALILYSTSGGASMPGEEILYGGSSVWNLCHVTFPAHMLGWPPDFFAVWTLLPYTPRHSKKYIPSRYLIESPTHLSSFLFLIRQNIQVRLYSISESSSLRDCCCPLVGRNIVLGLPSRMLFPNMTDRVPRPYKTTGEIIFLYHTYHKTKETLLLILGLYYMTSRF